MRALAIITAAIVSVSALAAIPAVAGPSLSTYRPGLGHIYQLCLLPDELEKVCIQWAPPSQPGQLFGACLKYQLECVAPAHIQ